MVLTKKHFNKQKLIAWIKLLAWLTVPLVLLAMPKGFFDNRQSLCLSVLLFDVQCYGCGLTRACMHLIHLDFETAYHYNKLVVIVFPILCYLYATEGITICKQIIAFRLNQIVGAHKPNHDDLPPS
jgi:Protein of unknown function (DUF2752)